MSYWPHSNPEQPPTPDQPAPVRRRRDPGPGHLGPTGRIHPCPGPRNNHDQDDAPLVPTPLCDHCERDVQRALVDLPGLYVDLWLALTPGARGRGDKVRGSRSAPIPIDLGPEELMRQFVDVLGSWAEVIRAEAGLAAPGRRPRLPSRRAPRVRHVVVTRDTDGNVTSEDIVSTTIQVRQQPSDATTGWHVWSACAVLRAHLGKLLALPATPVGRRIDLKELEAMEVEPGGRTMTGGAIVIVELDGGKAALELLELKHRARRMLGHTRGKDRLPAACPNLDCGAMALVRWHGADQVDCEECGRVWTEADYKRLVVVLASESKRAGRGKKSG